MLIAEGGKAALFDVIEQEKGEAFAAELNAKDSVRYYKVDITSDSAVSDAVERVVREQGDLKGVVHCAGVAIKRPWTNDVAESIPNFKKVSHRSSTSL